jgi:hypothetical protein
MVAVVHLSLSLLEVNQITFGEVAVDKEYSWCEPIRDEAFIRQPTNAWTAMSFSLCALFVLFLMPPCEPLLRNVSSSALKYLVILTLLFLGLGSFFYHAALTYLSFYGDFLSIAMAVSLMVAFTISRWLRTKHFWWIFSAVYIGTSAIRILVEILARVDITAILIVYVFGTIVSEYTRQFLRGRKKDVMAEEMESIAWLHFYSGFFAIGGTAWLADAVGRVCIPVVGGFQLHALFHAFLALATLCAYLYVSNFPYYRRFYKAKVENSE